MIVSFGSKETRLIWEGQPVSGFMRDFQDVIRDKLKYLHRSRTLLDLMSPPSNRLEKLSGDLKGYHSIRVNRQWRIIFIWEGNNASEVKIIDYH